ncbi:MAG TPA: CHRD domain-containing protein [Thermoanaerobaculia bacterium]|jgi:hypothetical protein
MRKIVLVAFVLLSCLASAAAAQTAIVRLTGANESPGPGDSDGFGLAGLRIEGTTISFTIMVQGIAAPTASHIHRGAAGVAGPVVVTLSPSFPNNVATGTASASADLIDEIRRNPEGFYVNVHNAEFPNGAIRGQLTPGVFSVMTGANEFPGPGDPDGFGMAVFYNQGGATNYAILVQGIGAPNASHIHRGAPGVAGPVVITLATSFPNNVATGSFTASDALSGEILANPLNFYVNVHNAEFPDGAIRGPLTIGLYAFAVYFPVVGKAAGLNNTQFVADLRIVNTTSSPALVQLEFFPSTLGGLSAASAIRGMTIAPGAEAVINDVVGSQFSTSGLGALKVGHSGGQATGVRVFNDQRPINQGTTGFFIPPRGLFGAATGGVLPFLSQAGVADIQAGLGFRTNIGCFNPNLIATPATFTAHRASDGAVIGTVNVVIPGLLQVQDPAFSLISTVAPADQVQTDFYVTWTSTLPIYIYGAVVDNKTGDVVYVD